MVTLTKTLVTMSHDPLSPEKLENPYRSLIEPLTGALL